MLSTKSMAQNGSNSPSPWFDSNISTFLTASIFIAIIACLIYLYRANNSLKSERSIKNRQIIDLKSDIFKKDSQFKETSLALQIIKENTFDAVIMLNNLGRITFWNSAAERLFGYKFEEVDGSDLMDVIIPKDIVEDLNIEYNSEGEHPLNISGNVQHITAVRKNGVRFSAELSISDVRIDDTWNTVGIIRDVSDSKTLEKELRLSENRLKLAMHGEEENLWDWNVKTNEMYFSPPVQTLLGHPKKEIYRKYEDWLKMIHPDDNPKVINEFNKLLSGKINMVRIEYRMKSAYGNWNWLYTRGMFAEFDDEKKPMIFVGTNTDINEQKEYELDVTKLQQQLEVKKSK